MDRERERGEGKMGGIIALLVIAALGYCAWNAGPVYLDNWQLKDKMNEIARLPRGSYSDDKILNELDKYLRQSDMNEFVSRSMFRVNTRETGRMISVSYERLVKFLPGIERTVTFEATVDQTLLF